MEFTVQDLGPLGGNPVLEPGSHLWPTPRDLHRIGDRTQVQPRPGDQQGSTVAGGYVLDGHPGVSSEVGHVELITRGDQVEAVVGHGSAIGGRRLGGTDGHTPVDLHGIDGDDLGTRVSQGVCHGHVALTRGRRADDDQGSAHPARTGIRRLWTGSARTSTRRPIRWWGAADVTSTVA